MNPYEILMVTVVLLFVLIPLLIGILIVRSINRHKLQIEQSKPIDGSTDTDIWGDRFSRRSLRVKNNHKKIAITILDGPPLLARRFGSVAGISHPKVRRYTG